MVTNVNNKDKYNFALESERNANLHSITKINLTNSYYTKENSFRLESGHPSSVSLNINSLNTLKKIFYQKIVSYPEGETKSAHYDTLQDMIISNRSSQDFQAICDLLYFNKLVLSGNISFSGKVVTSIGVNFADAASVLHKMEIKTSEEFLSKNDIHEFTKSKIKNWKEFISKLEVASDDIVLRCIFNLLFELYFLEVINLVEISANVACKELLNSIKKSLDKAHFNEKDYYLNAIIEIEKFRDIVIDAETVDNGIPLKDLAYEKYWLIGNGKTHKVTNYCFSL